MDEYKRILKNKNLRYRILSLLRVIPDKSMLQLQYWIKLKRKLNLESPERFTEKIQWYKLNYKNPVMPRCSDKYTAREYVKEKGLSHILTELYAVFEKPEDIKLEVLPDKFVLKLSNGSGTNLICRDKSQLAKEELIQTFHRFLFQVNANPGREWPYMQAKPVIIAEQLLEDETHINNAVNDYKIFCYDGKPEYIICISDRYSDKCNHLVYDTEWNGTIGITNIGYEADDVGAFGCIEYDSVFENVGVNASINIDADTECYYVGGLVGYVEDYNVFNNCYVIADIDTGYAYYAGGLCGYIDEANEFYNC